MKLAAALLIVALPSVAVADGDTQASLGDGYTLIVDKSGLVVVKDKRRAKLAPAFGILDTKVDKKAKKVDVVVGDYSCSSEGKYAWTFGQLDAKIENAYAFGAHRKKDYKTAAAGFAKAAAADPAWNIPAYNLASALQLSGDKDGAIKALAPWLASAPIATYVQVTADLELSPLLDRPELKAIRTTAAGNATIKDNTDVDGFVAYSKDKGLIAVARDEGSWGGCGYGTDLELRDAKTGKLVATTPIVTWDDTSDCDSTPGIAKRKRPGVNKRIKALTALLRELGFSKLKTEKGTTGSSDSGAGTARFAKAKLGVAAANGTARAMIKDKELGQTAVLDHLREAVYVEDPKMIVLWSIRPGAEGCEATDPTDVSVLLLAP